MQNNKKLKWKQKIKKGNYSGCGHLNPYSKRHGDIDFPGLRVISYGIHDPKVECLQNHCSFKAGPVGPNVIASSMQMGLDK